MKPSPRSLLLAMLLLSPWADATAGAADYDMVINGGRVLDPETGLDGIRNVAIRDGTIVRVVRQPLRGDVVIDASGLVVAPGFIDLHAHGQDPVSARYQAADGVTTALELEIGVLPLGDWLASRAGRSPVHYGASAGHPAARYNHLTNGALGNVIYAGAATVTEGEAPFATHRPDGAGMADIVARLTAGLDEGALGIGLGISYTPGASHEEIYRVFELAARRGAPVFVHVREADRVGGDALAPVQEVLADAAATGASLHIVHLNSSTDRQAPVALAMIHGARQRGLDVTTEFYPYTAGSTRLDSALFDGWQGDYHDLQWTATGERLTEETFHRYRRQGGWVIIHGQDPEVNRWLAAQPDVIVASDGVPFVDGFSHPRSAGTFARMLGHYVRERGAVDLMTAITKMTLLPARRLEQVAPGMARKGRLQKGADADITIFDPETVADRATFMEPAKTSVGIRYVLVKGTAVVKDGRLQEGVFPGEAISGHTGAVDAKAK
jgi:N-acyl-D-aspartate/D-glutamate deacylase